jgi:hypothetical protein
VAISIMNDCFHDSFSTDTQLRFINSGIEVWIKTLFTFYNLPEMDLVSLNNLERGINTVFWKILSWVRHSDFSSSEGMIECCRICL